VIEHLERMRSKREIERAREGELEEKLGLMCTNFIFRVSVEGKDEVRLLQNLDLLHEPGCVNPLEVVLGNSNSTSRHDRERTSLSTLYTDMD
jgi:hypothetical protein